MPFAASVKDELARIETDCKNCSCAELSALVRAEGELSANYRLEIATETAPIARKVVKLLHKLYNLKTDITTRRSILRKNYNYLITVPSQKGLKEALISLGIISKSGLEFGIPPKLLNMDCCKIAYLRGAFLGGGFISDPKKDFHFEISCRHEGVANDLTELIREHGIMAKAVQRRNDYIVYLKKANQIVDFLALTGAHKSMLDIENVRVTKSVKSEVNRRLNAEIANQAKSVDAAFEQVKSVKILIDKFGLESLPPALAEIARVRLAHPTATLKELGELTEPHLTKSAVYHRIRRIQAMINENKFDL